MSEKPPVNILLVDDQPAKLLSYEAILAPLGENLLQAGSGREALEHLLRTDIAVILIDVCMPDLDGFELASMIREHPRHQRTAIIFVSAVSMSDVDRVRGYEAGGVDYVSVPIVPEILRARVSVFADLHRKAQQLERLNLELEDRVAERTAALEASTALLRRSEEALRQSDRRKDEFLAMLAHELRNPLAPIRNSIEIARGFDGGDRELAWVHDTIDRQVAHLTRLVDDLLDVSRITRGTLEIRREPVDLADVVRVAVEAIGPGMRGRGQQLHVTLPAAALPLEVDVVRMNQVLVNLLDNACKFTPEGGSVWLIVERDGPSVVLRVRDSGPGLRPEDVPRLFELFYQSAHPEHSPKSGLGIGLSLARRLVELHGGMLSASNREPGPGSEFEIRLPAPSSDRARPAAADEPAARAARVDSAPARRILVVDDNLDAADSLTLLLRHWGHEVRTAYNGPEALSAAAEFEPEVALLDLGLPGLDGYEVAARIRAANGGDRVLLIAVTGWGQLGDMTRSRAAGIDRHLVKPADPATLRRLLADPVAARAPASPAERDGRAPTAPSAGSAARGLSARP